MELRPGRAGALVDSPDGLVVDGAPPGGLVRIEANLDLAGQSWSCSGEFVADGEGSVDTTRDASSGGSYTGVDPFGLFWSAEVSPAYDWDALHPMRVTLRATCDDLVGDASYLRKVQADDTTWFDVDEEGVVGRLFLPAGSGGAPAAVLVAGAVGGRGLPETAPLLAAHGVAVLSLAHWNHPGLPEAMREIDVEVVGRACDWLRSRDEVRDPPPAVVGAARGGELALLAASLLPDRVGPAASLSGSAVACGAAGPGTDPSDAAWSHAGEPVAHLSRVDDDWDTLLADEQAVAAARIPVERATGPLLLLSGDDDRTWPSARLSALGADLAQADRAQADRAQADRAQADRAQADRAQADRAQADRAQGEGTPEMTCVAYPDAGHLACVPPGYPLASRFELPGGVVRELGGTRAGNHAARLDSWRRLLAHVDGRTG